LDLVRVATVARRWWVTIMLIGLLAAGLAFGVSQLLPKEYTSEAKVLVGSLTETSTDQLSAYQELARTYAELSTSTPMLDRVRTALGLTEDPGHLADRLDVRAQTGQGIIRVDATAPSAAAAAELANAMASEIVRLAQPSGSVTSLAAIVQPALPPDAPTSPRVALNSLVAGILGLALGLGLALLLAGRMEASRLRRARIPGRGRRKVQEPEPQPPGPEWPAHEPGWVFRGPNEAARSLDARFVLSRGPAAAAPPPLQISPSQAVPAPPPAAPPAPPRPPVAYPPAVVPSAVAPSPAAVVPARARRPGEAATQDPS